MNLVCLMDPIESINPLKDTSYALLKKAEELGHSIYFLPSNGLSYQQSPQSSVLFEVRKITFNYTTTNFFEYLSDYHVLTEDDVECVLIRTDPPFDDLYLANTWLLDRCTRTIVFNNPSSVRMVNEKIWATQFNHLTPDTFVTSSISQIKRFLEQHKKIVVKPINGFGGQSIFILSIDDLNINATLETVTLNGRHPIICQEFIEASTEGDKRILLCNGNPLGAVLRKQQGSDPRHNFFAGGVPLSTTITENDLKIVDHLSPRLIDLGLFFVGIDIIGGKLIEVNVTSPTCLQEISNLENKDLAKNVIESLESMILN